MLARSPETVLVVSCLLTSLACSDGSTSFGATPKAEAAGSNGPDDAGDGGSGAKTRGGSSDTGKGGNDKGGNGKGGNASESNPGSAGSEPSGGEPGGGVGSGGTPAMGCDEPPSAAPEMKWVNATGNLAGMESECGNLGLVSAQPCSSRVIAGVAKKGLWETLDGGKSWQQLGTGADSAKIVNRVSSIVYDPADPRTFWESDIYNDGCVYRTHDSGQSFERLGDVSHCDSVSIDMSDPERKTLLAGTHGANAPLHLSIDAGKSWSSVATGLPAGICTSTLIIDASTFLVGCDSGSIVRTTNQGASWQAATGSTGGTFQPLLASDGRIYWPGSAGGVARSDDQGESFQAVADAALSPGIVAPAQFAELPDGRIVINGQSHLLASSDHGKTWQPIGEELPLAGGGYSGIHGLAYSARSKTFFVWHWDCEQRVPDDAIWSMGFDWETH